MLSAVSCVIVKIIGSAPQAVGARMWVTAEGFFGTLGGGRFELEVIEHCRGILRAAAPAAELKEYTLCREMGQCCGGRVQVFFEPSLERRSAILFGGGHVGRALAQVLSGMPLDAIVVDPRPEWAGPGGLPPDIRSALADPLEFARSREWTPDDAACVFTHSHDLDFELVSFLLSRPIGYLGLIGSEHKAEVFKARLRGRPGGDALADAWEERMHCPMGAPLDSKNPKIIAVSIAAELLKDWGLKKALARG